MAVYFIQNIDTGHIKIGKSFMVQKRLEALSKQEYSPLKLLGVIEGYSEEERDLHLYFEAIRHQGEWFHSESELLEFIEKHAIPLDTLIETVPKPHIWLKSEVKALAENRGYKTPEALSKVTDLTTTTVRNVWTGDISKRQFGTLYAIAHVLDVAMEDLVTINDYKE